MVCSSYGIFDVLHGSPQSAAEVASKVGISTRGANVLLHTMEAAGYVVKEGERFRNSKISQRWLTKASAHYIGNLMRYFERLFHRWEYLGETAQRGDPRKPYFEYFDDGDWEIYVRGMRDLARILMPQVLKTVLLPSTARRLLDIGGSHGLYSIELCKRYRELTADVLDFEKAVEVGKRITEELGMSSRVVHRSVDFKKDDLGTDYDVVLAFNVIHGLKPLENLSLMKKIAAAMNKGGVVFIMDQVRDGVGTSSLSRLIPAIVGLNLFNEIGGNAYTYGEIRDWCNEAGLVGCVEKKLRVPGVAVIQARKP
jgi:2-polyprenyl-3-methyl-5-hydroxy-6-metoxy-1,4-benzoquinol methylase